MTAMLTQLGFPASVTWLSGSKSLHLCDYTLLDNDSDLQRINVKLKKACWHDTVGTVEINTLWPWGILAQLSAGDLDGTWSIPEHGSKVFLANMANSRIESPVLVMGFCDHQNGEP